MKITATSLSQNYGSHASLSDGTNFQQLIQGLEKNMWSGAHAGPSPTAITRNPVNMAGSSQAVPFVAPMTGAVSSEPPVNPQISAQRPPCAPVTHSLEASSGPASLPFAAVKSGESGMPSCLLDAIPPRQPRADASAEEIPSSLTNRRSLPCPRQEASDAREPDRLNILSGKDVPAIVVRYSGDDKEIQQLRRALQETLRRHGIDQASLTVNGAEYPTWMEGPDYGY